MKTVQTKQSSSEAQPAARQAKDSSSSASAEGALNQRLTLPSRSGESLAASINASSSLSAQRKLVSGMEQSSLSTAQRRKSDGLLDSREGSGKHPGLNTTDVNSGKVAPPSRADTAQAAKSPGANNTETAQRKPESKDSSSVGHDEIFDEMGAKDPTGKAATADATSEAAEMGVEAYSAVDDFMGAVTHDPKSVKADGTQRNDAEQKQWLIDQGHTDKEADEEISKVKAADATNAAVTGGIGTAISFLKIPAMWQKLKKAENNYEKFEQVLEGASMATDTVATGAKIADAASGATDTKAQDTSTISEYTGGIINLVKSGYKSCLKLKDAYEDYNLIKENTDEDPSKIDAGKIAFEDSLSITSGILTNINSYQQSFGAAQNPALQAAIPAIGIAMSTISLIGRIVTLAEQDKLDFGKTATESQTASILSSVNGNDEQKAKIKDVLESEGFRQVLATMAEYRQQQRDNPAIFAEYKNAIGDADLQKRLKKRYPKNYERIDRIYQTNQIGIHEADVECQKLIKFGVSKQMLDAIVEDQTLISHLEEVKTKRTKNAAIGIFTDLVNIGADIAILSGAGATVGAGMKAGTAAIDVARKGGNAIKFAARGKGAEDFAGGAGAKRGRFGKSMLDKTDILKNNKAKQERYFNSSRLILDNMADHDKNADKIGESPTDADLKANENSYNWVEMKVLGTGASITMVKALLNSDKKTANDIVKYFMDKLKSR